MRTKEPKAKRGFMDNYKTYDTSNGFGDAREWQGAFYERMTGEEAAKVIREQEETPHQILGVSKTATQAEIKAAFRVLIKLWHPDLNPNNQTEAKIMSQKIIAAYTLLTN